MNKNLKKYLYCFLGGGFFIICCLLSFNIGQSYPKFEKLKIVKDTLIKRDTLTIEKPVEKVKWKDKLVYVPINIKDTIYKNESKDSFYVAMQTEKIEYEGEDYKAIVSGIYPKLESISVYPKNIYITEKQTQVVNKHWNFNINIGPGIFYNGDFNYGVGAIIGFGYSF